VLLAVPNVSDGRDADAIAALGAAFERDLLLFDVHSDATHNRSVFTLGGEAGVIPDGLLAGARVATNSIDMHPHRGAHPCIGALDVCPVVYLRSVDRDPARRGAVDLADAIDRELDIPVFLYGELASSPERQERSYFRRGGLPELTRRMRAGELKPDRGPAEPHRTAGATLVTARPPLAAFNVVLDTSDLEAGQAVAGELRESEGGLPWVRAIALELPRARIQIAINIHDPVAMPLGVVIAEVRRLGEPRGTRPVEAELVGLIPEAAMEGYPEDVPLAGFDPDANLIERRLPLLDG
jgi:glutamate formiminotransferase / 5-formyltetrahydrofolate cyclo-ligase